MVKCVEKILRIAAQRTRITLTKAISVECWKQKSILVEVKERMGMPPLWLEELLYIMRHLNINVSMK